MSGYGLTHQDTMDVKVSIWIAPRDSVDDSVGPSTENVVAALDSAIKKKQLTVSSITAESGKLVLRDLCCCYWMYSSRYIIVVCTL